MRGMGAFTRKRVVKRTAPEAEASEAVPLILNLHYAVLATIRLPATADLADVSVEVLAHDAAVTAIGVTVVVGVTAITGAVIIVTVVIAVARANADTDTDRTRADPHTLRACRHRQCDARRSQDSDCKLPHWEPPWLLHGQKRAGAWGVPV